MEVAETERFYPFTEFPSRRSLNGRSRLLFNSGVAILGMAHKVYTKVEEIHGPLGSLAQTLASMVGPLAYTMQYQWLAFLAFADDQILAIQNAMVTIFPPSASLFRKFDFLDEIFETLPDKFDQAVDHFPGAIRQVQIMGCGLTWLNSLLNIVLVRKEEAEEEEEEGEDIREVHVECTDKLVLPEKSPVYDEIHVKEFKGELALMVTSAILDGIPDDDTGKPMSSTEKSRANDKFSRCESTCKEIQHVEDGEEESGIRVLDMHAEPQTESQDEPEARESGCMEGSILELFEAGWHVKTSTRKKKS